MFEVGETIEHLPLTLRVESLDGRRIRSVYVTRKVAQPDTSSLAVETDESISQAQTVTD